MVREEQKYLQSPGRRTPTQEFDYRDLIEDKDFHALVQEKRQGGFFDGVKEGTAEFNSKLKIIALDFVRVEKEDRAALFLNRGILYAREYKIYRESISCYNRALEISHNSPSRHVTLANRAAAFLKTEEYSDALADAQEAARLSPTYAIAHSLVGYCQSQLGQLREATVNYKLALKLNPADKCSQELLEDAKRTLKGCGGSIDDIKTPTLEVPFPAVESYEKVNLSERRMDENEPTHRRYLNSMGRVSSLKELVRKALLLHDDKDLQGVLVSVDGPSPPFGSEKLEKKKTSVKKINSLKSIAKLPGKLKQALLKKTLGSSLPEPLEVSAGGDDLHENITKARKGGNEESAKRSPGSPQIGQSKVSKKTPTRNDSLVYSRSLDGAGPFASTSSSVSTPVGDAPLVPGDETGGSISEGHEPEQREAWESPPCSDNPGIITSECIPFDEEDSEEKAASPETVGYNESVLQGCLPLSTPVCKEGSTPPCPDGFPVSSEETGPEAQSHKTSQVLPGSEHHGSVPLTALPRLDEESMLPCSLDPQLGPMNAQEAIASTPQSSHRAVEDASYISEGQQRVVRLRRDEDLDALLMNTSQKLAWTCSEASNESEYSECESSDNADIIKFGLEKGVATAVAEAEISLDGRSGLHVVGEDRRNDANIQSLSDSNHSTAPGLINYDTPYPVDAAIEKTEGKRVLPSDS